MKKVISDQQLRPFSPTEGVAPAFIVKGSPREMGYQYGCQFVSKPSLLYNHKTTAARFLQPENSLYALQQDIPEKEKKRKRKK